MEVKSQLAVAQVEGAAKRRTWGGYLGLVARGYCMGSADVVPGVSGGTLAFILGTYEELVDSVRSVARAPFLQAIVRLQLKPALDAVNFPFLAALLSGVLLAVVTLAPGIEWMLTNQPILIWSFFFGLVLASVITVGKRIQRWTATLWGALLCGAAGAFWLAGMVPVTTPDTWWFLVLSGALAICAMILPGISGSFILVLLGKYQFFLAAVNQRDFMPLLWAGFGATIGVVTFAQILGWLFRRYHDFTVAVLAGFMLGSLRKVWPWKEIADYVVNHEGVVITAIERNILPTLTVNGMFNIEVLYAVTLALAGLLAVVVLERWAFRADDTGV